MPTHKSGRKGLFGMVNGCSRTSVCPVVQAFKSSKKREYTITNRRILIRIPQTIFMRPVRSDRKIDRGHGKRFGISTTHVRIPKENLEPSLGEKVLTGVAYHVDRKSTRLNSSHVKS